jgi:hypothetical protein
MNVGDVVGTNVVRTSVGNLVGAVDEGAEVEGLAMHVSSAFAQQSSKRRQSLVHQHRSASKY